MTGTERLLDVSTLEPPEPLVRTLAAVARLAPGEYLRMRHRMKPCLLYERIEPQGFHHDTRRNGAWCEVFIWHDGDAEAAADAAAVAQTLPPWTE